MTNRKKNVLVTGSKGFLGTNLINFFNNYQSFNIFEFTRRSSFIDLNSYIEKIDFIFHFAGAISINNSVEEFQSSNTYLTDKLLEVIVSKNLSIPILYTSSIHAIDKLGDYGRTKSESEELLIKYSSKSNTLVYILRLPHVYGEFQKKDRGSFLTDSICNIIENKEINMKNPNNFINYLYVQDLLIQLYELFVTENTIGVVYPKVKNIDRVDVGSVINYIYEFKSYERKLIDTFDNDFKEKLYKTYSSYI